MQRGEKLAVAETSAGGALNSALTDIAGSSKWYAGGAVPYTSVAKAALCGLTAADVEREGSVSAFTAREMAQGIRSRLGATWGIGETGIAGPQAGRRTPKPAGITYLAVFGVVSGQQILREQEVQTDLTDRIANKQAFTLAALALVLEAMPVPDVH